MKDSLTRVLESVSLHSYAKLNTSLKHSGIGLASWFNEFSTSAGTEVISPYLAYFFHMAIFIDYGLLCRILLWTVKNKILFEALGSSLETNCNPGSTFDSCVFLWTKVMTAGHLLHDLVFSDTGWELPSSHEGSCCHWDYTTFAGVGCGFHTGSVLNRGHSHVGNILQHKFPWEHHTASWVLGAPCGNVPYFSLCAPAKIRTDSWGSHLQGVGSCQCTQTGQCWEKLNSSGYSGS